VPPGGIKPLTPGLEILGISSDHLIVDVTDCSEEIQVGNEIRFIPTYGGLLALMTSPYVIKTIIGKELSGQTL